MPFMRRITNSRYLLDKGRQSQSRVIAFQTERLTLIEYNYCNFTLTNCNINQACARGAALDITSSDQLSVMPFMRHSLVVLLLQTIKDFNKNLTVALAVFE